jgi:DNA-binding MarR family transcriptional regulator
MAATRKLNSVEERAWRSLQFMQLRLSAELSRELSGNSDLSYPDFIVLVALTNGDGQMRIFELAHQIGWEKSRLSHHIGRMSQRRLVTREKCDADRRGAFVVVTKRGRKELELAAPGHLEAVRRLFIDQLTPEQLVAIRDASEATLLRLDAIDRS